MIGRKPYAQTSEEKEVRKTVKANSSQQKYARGMKARMTPMMSTVVDLRAKIDHTTTNGAQ